MKGEMREADFLHLEGKGKKCAERKGPSILFFHLSFLQFFFWETEAENFFRQRETKEERDSQVFELIVLSGSKKEK